MAIDNSKLRIKNAKWFCAVFILILSSCSLQKRLYNKGFYTSTKHTPKKTDKQPDKDTLATLLSIINPGDIKEKKKHVTTVAVNDSKPNTVFLLPNTKLIAACDTLVLRNGTKILVKVSEVNPEQIKFRYCNAPDEPHRVLSKTDIDYIVYANGYKEVVVAEQQYQVSAYNNYDYKRHRTRILAIIGLIFFLISVFLIVILFIPSFGIGADIGLGAVDLFFALIFFIVGLVLLISALATSASN